MRPLELTLQGFKSYRDKCSFNFEGRSLFGIVGPTGSGKSSILDGLIYCLYGKTPRLERETRKLINSQMDEAKLQLAFDMEGVVWQVTRVVRRKGQSQVVLERPDGGADPVTGDRNVNERLPQILGLDFSAFCASVCLSQGEFDRFLSATPSERVQILKGVFALDKVDAMREAAKGHGRLVNEQMRLVQGILETLPPDLEAGIEEAGSELAGALQRVEEIGQSLPNVREAEHEIERSQHQMQQIIRERQQTQTALSCVPPDGVVQDLVERQDSATRAVSESEKAVSVAEAVLKEAEGQLAAIESEGRGWEWCSRVETELRAAAALESEHSAQLGVAGRLETLVQEAEAELSRLETGYAAAVEAWGEAKNVLAETEQRHAAQFLRSHLALGEPCPVCEQPVPKLPGQSTIPALDAARAACSSAEEAAARAREALESARRDHVLVRERRRSSVEMVAAVAKRLSETRASLARLAGEGRDPQDQLEKSKGALQRLTAKAQAAASDRQKAFLGLKQVSAILEQVKAEFLQTVTVLGGVCGQLGVDPALIKEEGLPQTIKRLHEYGALQLEDLEQRAAQLTASVQSAHSTVAAFRSRFGARSDESPAEVLGQAISRVKSLENRIEELTGALNRRKEAEVRMDELTMDKALYDRLSSDLTDAKFTAYLLTEQTRVLCELASEKFHQLTGYYTFDFDAQGNITVVDERTGAVRSPQDTLSGGESFLASLSLALALAETVANRGGRLECFFLDEGFGSLDAEALDRALEGIQNLAEPGRMIALISHVGGIQSQLEDLIVLERNTDGSTSIVQDGGPIAYLPTAI